MITDKITDEFDKLTIMKEKKISRKGETADSEVLESLRITWSL